MKLYLVRHGKAVAMDASMSRPLSDEGKQEITRVARHLETIKLRVPRILHSSLLRAEQTAKILADVVNEGRCELFEGLMPDDSTRAMMKTINQWTEDVMLVGHLPFMGILASQLAAGDDAVTVVDFEPGTIVCLSNDNGEWKINWVIKPSIF